MEAKAKRTLVKSPPELWELADDPERMQAWTGDLVDGGQVEVEVTSRRPGKALAWRAQGAGVGVRVAIELAEKGFGTAVEVTAQRECETPIEANALERLLDELGSPDRRPFVRG